MPSQREAAIFVDLRETDDFQMRMGVWTDSRSNEHHRRRIALEQCRLAARRGRHVLGSGQVFDQPLQTDAEQVRALQVDKASPPVRKPLPDHR